MTVLPVLIAGVVVVAVGLLALSMSNSLSKFAASKHPYLRPGSDVESYRRRNARGIRMVGILQIVFGLGLIIFSIGIAR